MVIKGGLVFEADRGFYKRELFISGDRIVAEKPALGEASRMEPNINAEGCYVIPGLLDIHFHGCVGYDFCDGTQEAIEKIARYELENGITGINPATMTLDEENLLQIVRTAAAYKRAEETESRLLAELLGINMEGPFISEAKKGAQNPAFIHKPDKGMFDRLQKASEGLIRVCVVAPEEPGAMEFIESCCKEVVVSVAHTAADYDTAKEAFARGAKQVTHLYNGMPPFSHRSPGVIGAAFDSDCRVELICDGVHVHPSAIRATFKMFGDERIILISDSMMATGKPDGQYALGGLAVTVKGNKATLTEGGAIAGSVTNLMDCLRYTVKIAGIPLESAVKCATVNPAKAIGVFDEYGSLEPGKYADVVILDQDFNIKTIIKKGNIVK